MHVLDYNTPVIITDIFKQCKNYSNICAFVSLTVTL